MRIASCELLAAGLDIPTGPPDLEQVLIAVSEDIDMRRVASPRELVQFSPPNRGPTTKLPVTLDVLLVVVTICRDWAGH